MALYLVSVRKALNFGGAAYKWSNRYFCDVAGANDANVVGQQIWTEGEKRFHSILIHAYEVYVNAVGDPPGSIGFTYPIPPGVQRGEVSAGIPPTLDATLPLFNVIRVDFGIAGSRPSRKFYRSGLQEGEVQALTLVPSKVTQVQQAVDAIASLGDLRDVDNQVYTGVASVRGITSRRLGREAAVGVPNGPAFG